jgi:hypothetical protein
MTWKAVDVQMHLYDSGTVNVSGLIRNLWTTTAPGNTVTYTIGNSSDVQTSDPSSGTGFGLFGSTTYFPFSSNISPGTTSLDIQGSSFPIDDNIFIIPGQSSVDNISKIIVVEAAMLTSLTTPGGELTAVFMSPRHKRGVFR